MREDLRRVLRVEEVADFIQSASQSNHAVSEILPKQKAAQIIIKDFQSETETVVRPVATFGQDEKSKTSKILLYSLVSLLLIGALSLGVYFLSNQSRQTDSSKNEVAQVMPSQPNNNSVYVENANTTNANIVLDTPTPVPTPDKAQLQQVKYSNKFSLDQD